MTAASGWKHTKRNDVPLLESDRHVPVQLAQVRRARDIIPAASLGWQTAANIRHR